MQIGYHMYWYRAGELCYGGIVLTTGIKKRPPRERELISNQAKKVALVKNIFFAFLDRLQIQTTNEDF